jgi:large subunit ribosomal protein L24
MVRSDGQSLTFEDIKGKIGGGEAIVNIDARQSASGIALNARVQFGGVDGRALRYRALAMPAGRVSMQATLASQGRSASALIGALSGSGTVTLVSAKVAGLDPRAFEVAIRASDNGEATDDTRLRQLVEPARRPARCRSPRRRYRSRSGTAECASAPPRSMPRCARVVLRRL